MAQRKKNASRTDSKIIRLLILVASAGWQPVSGYLGKFCGHQMGAPRGAAARAWRPLFAVGLDAEADTVGPGIYGGVVERDADGHVVIGRQFEEHNATPGPVYAGGGYTELSAAILMKGPGAVGALLAAAPDLVHETSTGGATPLHVCGMSKRGQHSAALLIQKGAALEPRDTWGYTPLQRAATNNLGVAAEALVQAGASHVVASGREEEGESARDLALRLRSFALLRVF